VLKNKKVEVGFMLCLWCFIICLALSPWLKPFWTCFSLTRRHLYCSDSDFFHFKVFNERFLAISATSTAVVMAWPRAFRVTCFRVPEEKLVMIARTLAHWRFISDEDNIWIFSHFIFTPCVAYVTSMLLALICNGNVTAKI